MKNKIAIIGGGISGISAARLLHSAKMEPVVFEREGKIGGLIRCDDLPEGLYHKLGGHVFNTKSSVVADWFWSHFDREAEFNKIVREARILIGNAVINYPIENHLYQLPKSEGELVIADLLSLGDTMKGQYENLKEFLEKTFGKRLCDLYFFPYNEKIWRCDLRSIPVGWLEGKLPMPSLTNIMCANIQREAETSMVHSSFYYAKNGGSQFIVDRLSAGLDIRLNYSVEKLERLPNGMWAINGNGAELFDQVIYTGDIRRAAVLCPLLAQEPSYRRLGNLRTRGITNVFCDCDETSISWLYLPDRDLAANRIIYTGNFAESNNRGERKTCVVEFVYGEDEQRILRDLELLPGRLRRIAVNNVADAYVVQETSTRDDVLRVKEWGRVRGIYFSGRFAEWEYYNIDKAIEAAMKTTQQLRAAI